MSADLVQPGSTPATLLVMNEQTYRLQFGPPELARLRRTAAVGDPIAVTEFDSPHTLARLAETEVLLTSWGCPPINAQVLDAAPSLRAIIHAAGSIRGHVGPDVFDREVLVTTAADANAEPVAQYTLAAILWSFKKVPFLAQDARIHRADWSYRDRHGELSGRDRTVVIVGFSRIGRRVTELLHVTDAAKVLVVDPVVDPADILAAGAEPVELHQALSRADVLSLHAPLLTGTRGMIGDAELAELKPGATVINTARGGLVDTEALEKACAAGRIYAVLDVTEPEPLCSDSLLYTLPNVLITPHVAGSLGSEARRMSDSALTELERYATGRPPLAAITAPTLIAQA